MVFLQSLILVALHGVAAVQADRSTFEPCLRHLASNGAWEWHNDSHSASSPADPLPQRWVLRKYEEMEKTCPHRRFRSASSVRRCLRGKWIFMIGDSSTRVLFHHIIKVLSTPSTVPSGWEGYPAVGWMPSALREGKFCGASDNIIAHTAVLNCSQDYLHAATGTRMTFAMNTISNQRTVAWDRYVSGRRQEASTEESPQLGQQEFVDQKPWPSLDGESDERARPGPGASHKTPDILLFETGLWNSRYGPRTLTPNDPRPKDQPDLFRRTLDGHVVAYTQELERSFRGLKIWAGAPVCCNQFKHYAKRVSIDWARRFNAAAENNAHLNEHFVFWDRQVTSDVLSLRDIAVGGEHGEAEPPPLVEALRHDCTPGIYHPGGEVMQVQVDALLGALCPGDDPAAWWGVK